MLFSYYLRSSTRLLQPIRNLKVVKPVSALSISLGSQISSYSSVKYFNCKANSIKNMSTSSLPYPNISDSLRKVLEPHFPKDTSVSELDYSTNSNYENFKVLHSTLDATVSFDKKIISGFIEIELEAIKDTDKIILDSSYLDIQAVKISGSSEDVKFEVLERKEPLGSPFVIYKPLKVSDKSIKLKIEYNTTENCTALQWLDPQQTDGGKYPYLFSQSEPIHARSFFPCFDTPAVKSTYTFNIRSPLNALLAARFKEKKVISEDLTEYHYEQPVPVPSYLVAIASGDLVGDSIGPRSTVFSEPCMIKDCQYEFEEDTEDFIKTAESLIFDYEWGNYDVLVLNKAFPFGGMENCNLTFATPTLISKDRQNVDVIAHELAHSWSGNLVTNCSWDHFWLNEGWTVYIERRIVGKIHGEKARHFSAIVGWTDLENSIESMGQSAERYSTLVQDLKDRSDPDDAFSTVPYEKGFNLLYKIEQTLSIEKFSKFLPYYFDKFKYKSLDTYQFLDTLYGFFNDPKEHELLDTIDWELYLYKPGLPPKPEFDTTLVDECYTLAKKWVTEIKKDADSLEGKFSSNDIESFQANQNGVFLDTLVSYEGVEGFSWKSTEGEKAISLMSKIYDAKYNKTSNAEVLFRWFRLQMTGHIKESYPKVSEWLSTVGRMKFVRPAYVMLNKVDRDLALSTFKRLEMTYHPICRAMVKKDLGL